MTMKQVSFDEKYAALIVRVSTNNVSQDASYQEQYEMLANEMNLRGQYH